MTKDEMNKQLLQQVHSLTSTVDSLNATINAQTQLIAQLNQTIQELKEQLNKNSKNSSNLLLEMKKVKDKAAEKGKHSLSYYHYYKFDKKYDELIEQARKENPLPETTEKKRGRKKKGKILALDLRMIKVKTKVSGCFRTEEDARDYLKIMSCVGTAHKQGHNAYQAIKNAISGHPDFIFE